MGGALEETSWTILQAEGKLGTPSSASSKTIENVCLQSCPTWLQVTPSHKTSISWGAGYPHGKLFSQYEIHTRVHVRQNLYVNIHFYTLILHIVIDSLSRSPSSRSN